MNTPGPLFGGVPTQQTCAHCDEMFASNFIHTCDSAYTALALILARPRHSVIFSAANGICALRALVLDSGGLIARCEAETLTALLTALRAAPVWNVK